MASRDDDGTFPFRLQALDGSGRIVATESSTYGVDEDGDPIWVDADEEAWNSLISDLYRAARRVALRIDETLSGLLDDIVRGDQPKDDDIPF